MNQYNVLTYVYNEISSKDNVIFADVRRIYK